MARVNVDEITVKLLFVGTDSEAKEEFARLRSLTEKCGVMRVENEYCQGLITSIPESASFLAVRAYYWNFAGNLDLIRDFLGLV